MTNPEKLFGRLGNRMFQMAFCLAYSIENKTDIYFQDPKWFYGHGHTIKRVFSAGIPPKQEKVAIHVRRGDYVNNKFYVDLMENGYYVRAMEMFPDAEFLVFSDDIEWCKSSSIFSDCSFSENKSELDDMNSMASCVGIIGANSSFSWWAAYISPYAKKIVFPSNSNWYTDGIERTVCPKEWTRL